MVSLGGLHGSDLLGGRGVVWLIEEFVVSVEWGDYDDKELHFSDGAMSAFGLYEYCVEGSDRDVVAVELHFSAAFEDEVYLGEVLVVVDSGIL